MNIYDQIKKDFDFLNEFWFFYDSLLKHNINPSVLFKNDIYDLVIGYSYERHKVFISFQKRYDFENTIDVLKDVFFEKKGYENQIEKAKTFLTAYLTFFENSTVINKEKIYDYLYDKNNYTHLDYVLYYYLKHMFKDLLNRYKAENSRFYPCFARNLSTKKSICLKTYFECNNLSFIMFFDEIHYQYSIFKKGCSFEDFKKMTHIYEYNDDFELSVIIEKIVHSA